MGNWQPDPYHTQVEFSAKHLGMMTVRGHFADVSATFASTSVKSAGPDRYTLSGDLTIKGITRPMSLEVTKRGRAGRAAASGRDCELT
jgi:polyisoprenoid-binding protein YceI